MRAERAIRSGSVLEVDADVPVGDSIDNSVPLAGSSPVGDPMGQLTRMLGRLDGASESEWDAVVPFVYEELRKLARSKLAARGPAGTITPTVLVHEAYLKLRNSNPESGWQSRAHFYGAAARAMRNLLVDDARAKSRKKRGGDRKRRAVDLDAIGQYPAGDSRASELLDLDDALGALRERDDDAHSVVMLRYFGGLTTAEVAEYTETSVATVERKWAFSRAWLQARMSQGEPNSSEGSV